MRLDTLLSDEKAIVHIAGRIDVGHCRSFRLICTEQLQRVEVAILEIDVSGIENFNSSILGMLLIVRTQASELGKSMQLSNPDERTRRILEIANFQRLFPIVRGDLLSA